MANANLSKAKREKNDEFYTRIEDIEKELKHYKSQFKGKHVFLNCDGKESHFWKYFITHFSRLGLKRITAIKYNEVGVGTKTTFGGQTEPVTALLLGNGSFNSSESIEVLKECDLVITNPPFSMFREYIDILINHNKQFLVVGNMNAITYKETFKYIQAEQLWLGVTNPTEFRLPNIEPYISHEKTINRNGELYAKLGNVLWFTNLDHKKRNEPLILGKKYYPDDYPTYDNYEAINVDKVKDIPVDYFGPIGVPISYLTKHNPNQFEILGIANSARWIGYKCLTLLDGRKIYNRLIIQRIK